MIIHSISAKNVLKYQTLDLKDLPEEGIIAISGFNESGKSTIGETICFALFGRTFSIAEDDLDKIIRWGASDCSVTIRFSNQKDGDNSDEQYAITRMLDCDGNHSAKLYQVYNEDNPLARGVERVEETLFELTSVEFDEFIESFYLAQREITTPHPHSYALKAMAGIATMEYCEQGIQEDIEQDLEVSEELINRIELLEEEIEALELDDLHLDNLTEKHNQLVEEKAVIDDKLNSLNSQVDQYNEARPQREHYQAKKGRASFWRFISLLFAAASFGLWWVLLKMPDSAIFTQINEFLQANIPQFSSEYYPYLLYAGGGFTLLFIIFWAMIISHKGNIQRLGEAGQALAEQLRNMNELRNESMSEAREMFINRVAKSLIAEKELSEELQEDNAYLIEQQESLTGKISELTSALVIERERVKKVADLLEKVDSLQEQIDEKARRNQIRELSTELLMGATRHLSKRFNHVIRDHVSKTLPLFTENRYEHLQIDEDLTVRVFSNEKHDFMELDEISSGTQRQIMLAVRLALSQEMVSRKVHSRQFLILDEPFAFFDEERTKHSLAVLPELSDDLPQTWIIAQTFPDGMSFERTIFCEREQIEKTA